MRIILCCFVNLRIDLCLCIFYAYFWYTNQTMTIKWSNCLSNSCHVSNGVCQRSVLSPYLFAIYTDDLSYKLNKINVGCFVGNQKLNHIMYADDLCCFCPRLSGLKKLLTVCLSYAAAHNIVFNVNKSFGIMFSVKYCNEFKPDLPLAGNVIKFVNSVKYLGVFQTSTLTDDCDIVYKCSTRIKNMLFCALYASQLWCCYSYESYRRPTMTLTAVFIIFLVIAVYVNNK